MDSINPNWFIHVANVLLLVAYSVRDVLWLRLFAVSNALVAMPYFLLQPQPLWTALAWNVVFAGINSWQAWRLYLERRPVQLTDEEEQVRKLVFRELAPRKVLQVLGIGAWATVKPGEHLLAEGQVPDAVSLIVSGRVQVKTEGHVIGELGPGEIAGSAILLTGTPANVDAVAVGEVRALRWDVKTLDKYLSANPDTRIVLQRHLARDLAGKVRRILGERDLTAGDRPQN